LTEIPGGDSLAIKLATGQAIRLVVNGKDRTPRAVHAHLVP
jgi:hypothetical protein